MWFVYRKLKFAWIVLVIFGLEFFCKISNVFAATTITSASIVQVSTISADDDIIFSGAASGTLQINASKQLATLTTGGVGIGNVDFTSASTLTMTGIVGTPANQINRINFGSFDGTLDLKGATNSAVLGIITGTDNIGNLIFSGTSAQTVAAGIGSSTALRISNVTASNSNGVTFGGNLYLNNFTITEAATINGTGTVNINTLTIANNKTLTLSNDATINSVFFGSVGSGVTNNFLNFGADKIATITGNTTGTGSITTSTNNTGSLIFSGSAAQTISNQIGISGTKLAAVAITNTDTTKLVNFSKDIYATNLTTTNSSNITFSGSSAQIVDAISGSGVPGSATRFGTLTVSNSRGVNFKGDVFTGALVVSGVVSLDSGKTINTDGNISGGGTISGAGNLTLDNASAAQSVAATIGNSSSDKFGTINLTSTGGTSFSKNIYATSIIGAGKNITFNGSGVQTVDSVLGASGSNLNQITLNNSSGAVFNQNIFTDAFQITSGKATLSGSSINLGNTTIDNGGTLYAANNAAVGTLTSPGIISIASSKTLTASGNVSITGTLNVSVESLGVGLLNGGNITIADGSTINVDYSNV